MQIQVGSNHYNIWAILSGLQKKNYSTKFSINREVFESCTAVRKCIEPDLAYKATAEAVLSLNVHVSFALWKPHADKTLSDDRWRLWQNITAILPPQAVVLCSDTH